MRLLLAVFFAPAAHAATLDVCATCAYTTIQDAVDAAADGDTIAVAAGTYTEGADITRSVTLVGDGVSTIVDGAALRVTGSASVDVVISNLAIEAGGVYVSGATVALERLQIARAEAPAVWLEDAVVSITDCAFDENVSTLFDGGAILSVDSSVDIVDSTFTANATEWSWGGAIACYGWAYPMTISGSSFVGNRAVTSGAAIENYCDLEVRDTLFVANEGLTAISAVADTRLENVTVLDHVVAVGQYLPSSGYLVIVGSTFRGNDVAIDWTRGGYSIQVEDTIFAENGNAVQISGTAYGGGCSGNFRGNRFESNEHALLVGSKDFVCVTGNVFVGNRSAAGSAVYVSSFDYWYEPTFNPGSATLENNVFCANEATADGGAVWLGTHIRSTITNNVFVENKAGGDGGALWDGSNADVVNNTWIGNSAAGNGGAALLNGGSWYAEASWVDNLVVETTAGGGLSGAEPPVLTYGAWYANTPADHDFSTTLDATHLLADPLVAAWSADGDCSNDDYSLLTGSAAIDAGDPTLEDVDGSRADIGACGGPGADGTCTDDDGDGYFALFDCDDTDPDVFPGAAETCESVDRDCDGSMGTDDADRDGWMNCAECDDYEATTHPGADELCDAVDNDCDGILDEDGATWGQEWYADADSDASGDAATIVRACEQPAGYVGNSRDCDDTDPDIRPSAAEVWYDGIDQNCDGRDDFDQDRDGDRAEAHGGTDCDDDDRNVYPGADDPWYDGIDENCDGADDFDRDGDGERSDEHGGADCDDLDPAVNTAAEDEPGDGADSNCDGDDEPADTDTPGPVDPKCGCNASPSPAGAWLLLALVLARRRRNGRTPRFE